MTSADKSFRKPKRAKVNAPNTNPPTWFGTNCKKARKQFHSARYQYKLRKDLQSKENLKIASKTYKTTVRQYHKKFKIDAVKRLKYLKQSNPRRYWQILNGKTKNKVEATADSLFDFYKNINYDITGDNTIVTNSTQD